MMRLGHIAAVPPQAKLNENGQSNAAMFAGFAVNCDTNVFVILSAALRNGVQNIVHRLLVRCFEGITRSNASQNISMHPSVPVSDVLSGRVMERSGINQNICMKQRCDICQSTDNDMVGILFVFQS